MKSEPAQILALCDQWTAKLRDGTITDYEKAELKFMLHQMVEVSNNLQLAAFLTVISGVAAMGIRSKKKGTENE